jgi:DNA-directed RNA polymerase subunit K/omega
MAALKKNEEMEKIEEIESDVESIPDEESEVEVDEEDDLKKVESEEEEEEEASEAEASEAEEESEAEEASEAEEGEEEEEGEKITKKRAPKSKRGVVVNTIGSIDMLKASKKTQAINYDEDSEEEEEEDDDVNYLQKFDSKMRDNFILDHHPEARTHNYEEVKALTRVSRDGRGIIIDPLHKTIPILTKYEMTRVIGQRAKQLDSGARAFVKVPLNVVDGYLIALLELEQKKLPFIIKRPFPNGGVEYWNVSDLEVLL